jgi:hypothetical protein
MTEPVDDSYPESWKPGYIRERDEAMNPHEMELALAAMDPRERAAMLQRIQAMR